MKLCTVQPHMSDSISYNVAAITKWIHRAAESGADIVVFPEMMLTGYDVHFIELYAKPAKTDWHAPVDEALDELGKVVETAGISVLVGSPYRYGSGQLNALLLLQPGKETVIAGARSHLPVGDRNRMGFVEPKDRFPAPVLGIEIGSVFCAEVYNLDYIQGKGLEESDIILWSSVFISDINEAGNVIRDRNVEFAREIASVFNVPVIQSNYVSYASETSTQDSLRNGRTLGGSVACDASGQVLDQASWTDEEMRLFEIGRVDSTTVVKPVSKKHAFERQMADLSD